MEKKSTPSRSPGWFLLLLVFFLFSGSAFAGEIRLNNGNTEIRITANSYVTLSLSASLSSIQYRNVVTRLGAFSELFVREYGYSNGIGDPKLPVFHKLIEVPLQAGFSILVTNEKYREYDLSSFGITDPIIPAQAPLSKNITDPDQVPFVINAASYQLNQWIGGPLVKITPVGILRSLNLARMDVSPVWYNPVTGKLRVYEQLDITVEFTHADIAGTLMLKKQTWSPYYSSLSAGIFNYKQMPDSLITRAPVTYVIISSPIFQTALQPFIAWKKKKGFNVIAGYTNNPAVGTTTALIKNYLQGLYNNPPAGYQKPSFILFVGDVAQVPAWNTNGHPSDMYYCDYTGDNIPEVFYGRFSASNLTQLQPYIDKTLEYEQYTMPSDAFLGEVSMIAGADPTNGPLYGNGQINYGTNTYFNSAHGILSHTYLQPEPSGGNYTQHIHEDVSNGVAFSNYTAHGSESGWADPSFLITDIAALLNNHKYCLMVGNCCKTSNFGVNCFAEEITRAANKGALGYIGCSDYSYWDEDYWWGCGFKAVSTSPVYNSQHLGAYDVTFHDHGEVTSKWFVTQGQMVQGGCLAVEESSSGMKLYYWETYCLMGDPSLSIYFAVPPPVAAVYPSPVLIGTSSLTVTTEPYAYVSLTIHDTTILAAQCADVTGIVNLSFPSLTSTDPLSVVVTKQNRKPHIGSIQVIPASGPYVVLTTYTVNDSLGGNNNHLPDYGESILLNVTVKNIGVMTATNVSGTLSASDTNVTITSGIFNFGNLPAGGIITGQNAFALTIKNKVQDQHTVLCTLVLTDGTNTWNSTLLMTLNAPILNIGTVTVLDPVPGGNGNGILDPGESATLKILTTNSGHATSSNTIAHLTVPVSSAPYILISDPVTYIGSLVPATPTYAYFPVITNGITPVGTTVTLSYRVTGGAVNQYSAEDSIPLVIGETPLYIMGNTTTTTCGGKFFDSGGQDANYSDNENFTYTFNPGTAGAKIKAVFSAFDVELETSCSYDWLKVYNGPDINSPLLGTYCGTSVPGPFESTTGSLTFKFSSDYNVNATGWVADISCAGGPLSLAANAFPPDVCLGSSSQLVAIPAGGSGNYTYSWTPSTYLDDPTSRTPVSTPLADISYTVTVNDGITSATSAAVSVTVHALPPTPVITLTSGSLTSSSVTGNQWYLNGALIPGAIEPVYLPTESGSYYDIVSDPVTGCPSLPSNTINFLVTGTDASGIDGWVSVYPNPFRDKITITYILQEEGAVTISLFDAFGKELRVIRITDHQTPGKHRVELTSGTLNSGIYILKIQTQSYTVSKKIILSQ